MDETGAGDALFGLDIIRRSPGDAYAKTYTWADSVLGSVDLSGDDAIGILAIELWREDV